MSHAPRRYGRGAVGRAGDPRSSAEERDAERGVNNVSRIAMIAPITTIAITGLPYLAMSVADSA